MCGFCGFTGQTYNNQKIISDMMQKIIHRGPDSYGIHSDENITLGFRRLGLIDLNTGGQPMYNENKSIVIVFNGEIYNYLELHDELVKKGHTFHTQSDTETLIHAYEQYGINMFKYLRGMFAFVIYDYNKKRIFAARDFFGIKPLYYTIIDNEILFGSEIKSFLVHPNFKKKLNEVALENYLTFQYSVLPETFFKNVYKLSPGHYFTFQDGKLDIKKYWAPFFSYNNQSETNYIDEINNIVKNSVHVHQTSDVEVGSFLSSGVDSSFITACYSGDKTFTVGFDYDKYNEISYAEKLSNELDKKNISKVITTEEYWQSLPKIQYHMDEPLADPSAVALYFVSNLASKYVKTCLSGEGADEFFGGYNIYMEPMDLYITKIIPRFIRKFLARLVKKIPFAFKGKNFIIRASQTVEERFIGNAKIFSQSEREKILKRPTGQYPPESITAKYYSQALAYDDITKMQYIDINLWLVGDILLKADKMSMANSLELRVPYLDKKVFDVAASLPTNYRVKKIATKYAFRKAAQLHLPQKVSNKKKLGFPVPIKIWLRDPKYYSIIRKAFESDAAKKYFNVDQILKLLNDHKDNPKCDNSRKIWTVYSFIVWYEQFFNEGGINMITQINSADEFKEALTSDKIVLVDFYADWCGPCKMLSPIIDEIANEKNDEIKVCKVNVDQNQNLALEYSVQSIPTVISFKNGEIYKKSVGLVPKDEILNLLN